MLGFCFVVLACTLSKEILLPVLNCLNIFTIHWMILCRNTLSEKRLYCTSVQCLSGCGSGQQSYRPSKQTALVSKRNLNLRKTFLTSDNVQVSELSRLSKITSSHGGKVAAICQCKVALGIPLGPKEAHKQRRVIFNMGAP